MKKIAKEASPDWSAFVIFFFQRSLTIIQVEASWVPPKRSKTTPFLIVSAPFSIVSALFSIENGAEMIENAAETIENGVVFDRFGGTHEASI